MVALWAMVVTQVLKIPLRLRLALALMVSFSAQSLLIAASKSSSTSFAYNSNSAVLLAEFLKLMFAGTVVTLHGHWGQVIAQPLWLSLCFAAPGLLYALQNNLVFCALRHLPPGPYQLFNNFKILTTAVTFRLLIRKELRVIQWLALVLLVLGMCVTALDATSVAPTKLNIDNDTSILKGLWIMVCMSVCSGLASVSNEILIKRSVSVYVANVWLYAYGIIGSASYTLVTSGLGGFVPHHFFSGFDGLTWAVVFCSVFMGQSIAFIFRYADVIVKIYATCFAMAFTAAAAWVLFGHAVTFNLILGYLICACSFCFYYLDVELLNASDTMIVQKLCGKMA